MITSKKYGDWSRFLNGLQKYTNDCKETRTRIVKKAAIIGENLLKRNIQSGGTLAGAPFAANSAVTIAAKGSSKPLIDSGEFMGSITKKVIDSETSFAGVLKMSIHGANIPAIHEAGTNRAGRGNKVVIPARPWLQPVADSPILEEKVRAMADKEHQDLMNRLFS